MIKIARLIILLFLISLLLPLTSLLVATPDVKADVSWDNVYVNGTTGNDIDYDGSSPTRGSGSIGPKATIAAGITVVSENGTVYVAAGTYYEIIHLSFQMNLVGAGARTTIIDGSSNGTVITVSSMPTQRNTISGFTIQNGAATVNDFGGGIYISSSHIVTINDCAIINNTKVASIDHLTNWGVGAGICNDGGALYMNRCTVSGNTAIYNGGGIYNVPSGGGDSGLVELTNCTISGNNLIGSEGLGAGIYTAYHMELRNVTLAYNTATGMTSKGGGIASMPGNTTAFFKNCIVAYNTAGTAGTNNAYYLFADDMVSQGNNIDSENSCNFNQSTDQRNTNSLLGTLQDNGGPTNTHAITASSPAYNAGTNDGAPATDQRGVTRPQGTSFDIGAYEFSISSVATATGTGTATFTTSNGAITGLTAAASTPCSTPAGLSFPHGFFSFTITSITPGSAVTITITLPSNVPAETQYWKCINGAWVNVTSFLGDNDGDNVLTLTITDGGTGDADGLANGSISDPGGPVIPSSPAQPKPFAESSSAPQMPEHPISSPARLSIKYLNVQPQQAQANQPVTIYANIANGGDEAGNYTATLKVNGQVEETRTGRVGSHAAVPLKFEVLKNTPGIYNVDINGQKASFTIIGTSSNTDNSRTIPLIGFILCAIGVIVVSALLVLRRRNT